MSEQQIESATNSDDDKTKCTEDDPEDASSSEGELFIDDSDEDYVPTGGTKKPKVRQDSHKAISKKKPLSDDAQKESDEKFTLLISSNGQTSVFMPDGAEKEDDEDGDEDDDDDDDEDDDDDDDDDEGDEHLDEKSEKPMVSFKPKKTFECSTCGRVCPSTSALKRHLIIHSGQRPFRCFICGRGFTQSGNLRTHMKVHKGESGWSLLKEKKPPVKAPVRVNVCKDCGMVFPETEQLEEHKKTHQHYKCTVCGRTFKIEQSWKLHMEHIHSEDSTFCCKMCGKRFSKELCLKNHMLTHTAERKFKCDQCGRGFLSSDRLKTHLKTHTGERPHLCPICGKGFTQRYSLKIHLQAHTGEKRHVCNECGKRFLYDSSFQSHLKSHNKKPRERTKPLGRPKRQMETANDSESNP